MMVAAPAASLRRRSRERALSVPCSSVFRCFHMCIENCHKLFLERSRINDVAIGRRAINVSRGAASLHRPHGHAPLHIEGIHTSGYNCTTSGLGERGPPLSGIDVVGFSLFYVGIPTVLCTVLLRRRQRQQQRQQNDDDDDNECRQRQQRQR